MTKEETELIKAARAKLPPVHEVDAKYLQIPIKINAHPEGIYLATPFKLAVFIKKDGCWKFDHFEGVSFSK